MKQSLVVLLALLTSSLAWADFSSAKLTPHPRYPGVQPFILELTGTWPSDCHPGEQKPVIKTYDGEHVEIEFETIVVHVTCNEEETPYRVLIDMSAAVLDKPPATPELPLRLSFGESVLETLVPLVCPEETECVDTLSNEQLAEPGLYVSQGLSKQGLLVARQNEAMAIYPLVYDSNGKNEWLFTGATMIEDTFFTDLMRFRGGDCFGCEATGTRPKMSVAGRLSVLVDRPDLLQVKFDNGMFTAYESITYGYESIEVGKERGVPLVDLEGRWAVSENQGSETTMGDLTQYFPGAFDIERDKASAREGKNPDSGKVTYSVNTLTGRSLGKLVCKGDVAADGSNLCYFTDPTDAEEPMFRFYQQGPTRLAIRYARAIDPESTDIPPGGAAKRVD